jgi:phosphinothricin acetyltransferase
MRVREAESSDLEAIRSIYNHVVLHSTATADYEPQTTEARRAWWAAHRENGLAVVVAEEGGAVAGWAALNRYQTRPGYRFTVENSIYVAADARGRGVGTQLLARLIEEARRGDFHAIVAGVDASNEVSLRLHRSAGFRDAGRLSQVYFKFGRWLDVIYLQLLL